jgi:hypothetical protein
MGEFLFIYLFISLVGCFVYYENHKGGGGQGEATASDTFSKAMPAFLLLSDRGGTDFWKKYFAFKLYYLQTMKGF